MTNPQNPAPPLATVPPSITVRYPGGVITPAGAYHLLAGDLPLVKYRSWDDKVVFNMMGGDAIPDRTQPEAVILKGLKGLIPPWSNIKQKGAQQDGSTYVTSLYDELEVSLTVRIQGRDPIYRRQVLRDWIASWDAKQPGELSWFTPQLGRWWAPVRWGKVPLDKLAPVMVGGQDFTWTACAYDAFWRSYDSTDQFGFLYEAATDSFDYNINPGLQTWWDIAYTGTGGGWIYALNSVSINGNPIGLPNGGKAVWHNDPTHPIVDPGRDVICRRNDIRSATDLQSVSMRLGDFAQFSFSSAAANDLWARCNNSGTAGTDGIRCRLQIDAVILSAFVGGTETVIRKQLLLIPPGPGETWALVAGTDANNRQYSVTRNGRVVLHAVESAAGTPSYIDSSHRSWGFGMHAGKSVLQETEPAAILWWAAADNNTQAQSGVLARINCGDQPMWDRYTCYGPGTFTLGDGPDATQNVVFGPLLDNQIVQIRTDPRRRGVVDLSTAPPPPQQLKHWQQAIVDFVSFATAGNVPPLLSSIENLAGIVPPQGNLYSLLDGRFSKPIPPKEPGAVPQVYGVPVSITGGDAASRIIAAGTPLRRFPY
jgi:hypothetical protein